MLVLSDLGMSQGKPQELACQRQRAGFTVLLTGRQRHREEAMVRKKSQEVVTHNFNPS